jgi:hypothetical protein
MEGTHFLAHFWAAALGQGWKPSSIPPRRWRVNWGDAMPKVFFGRKQTSFHISTRYIYILLLSWLFVNSLFVSFYFCSFFFFLLCLIFFFLLLPIYTYIYIYIYIIYTYEWSLSLSLCLSYIRTCIHMQKQPHRCLWGKLSFFLLHRHSKFSDPANSGS